MRQCTGTNFAARLCLLVAAFGSEGAAALADTASLESLSKEELKARVSEVNGKIAEMRAHVSMLTQELSKANQELAKRSPLDVRNSVKLMELQEKAVGSYPEGTSREGADTSGWPASITSTWAFPGLMRCDDYCDNPLWSWTKTCKSQYCVLCDRCPKEGTPGCFWENLQDVDANQLDFYNWIGPGTASLKPGECYYKQNADNGNCGGQKSWTRDEWGEENEQSAVSEAKCLERKSGHDGYCGANSEWKFVPATADNILLDSGCQPEQDVMDAISAEIYLFGDQQHPKWEIRGSCNVKKNNKYNGRVRDTAGVLSLGSRLNDGAGTWCLTADSNDEINGATCAVGYTNPMQHFELGESDRIQLLGTDKCIAKDTTTMKLVLTPCSGCTNCAFEFIEGLEGSSEYCNAGAGPLNHLGRTGICHRVIENGKVGKRLGTTGFHMKLKDSNLCIRSDPSLTPCSDVYGLASHQGYFYWTSCNELYGVVSCPCSENGKKLTFEEAKLRILGQVAMLGFGLPDDEQGGRPARDRMKVGLATFKMLNCWSASCKAESSRSSNYDTCMAQAAIEPQGAAVRSDFEKGCGFMRDGATTEQCEHKCAFATGAPSGCCKCDGTCHQCPCAFCTSFCKNYNPAEETSLLEAKTASCKDPASSDPSSWDCDCEEELSNACSESGNMGQASRAECFKHLMCEVDSTCQSAHNICASWITANCPPCEESKLLQKSDNLLSLLEDAAGSNAKVGWDCG